MKLSKETLKTIFAVILFASLVVWGLVNLHTIFRVLSRIFFILAPVLIGMCLAFVINELMRPMELLWERIHIRCRGGKPMGKLSKKMRRPVCLIICYTLVLGMVAAIILIVIPELKHTIGIIGDSFSMYAAQIESWRNELTELFAHYSIALPEWNFDIAEIGQRIIAYFADTESSFLSRTLNATTSFVSSIVDGVLALVFSIYILAQKEKLAKGCDRILYALFSEKTYSRILSLAHLTGKTFSNFISGQLVEAVIIGALCFIGMMVFQMPYAGAISVLVGFTALIPVFGAFIGTGIGAFLILFSNPLKALWFVVFIIVLQQLEGNLIYPKVVGKSVGLPGIWVLFAVTVGGSAFGFIGMLISVPVCSILYTLFDTYIRCRLQDKKIKHADNHE